MSIPDLPPPNKRLGQNFLIDPNIVRKIVALAELGPSDHVLEIGPGRGILTEALCHAAGRVTAVEVDPRLHAYLETRQAELPNVELVCEDALAYPVESLPIGTVVVANLPYYISTPLLFQTTRPAWPVSPHGAHAAGRSGRSIGGKAWRVGLWSALSDGAVRSRDHQIVSCLSPVFPPQTGGRLRQCCCCARKNARGSAGRKKSHFARS